MRDKWRSLQTRVVCVLLIVSVFVWIGSALIGLDIYSEGLNCDNSGAVVHLAVRPESFPPGGWSWDCYVQEGWFMLFWRWGMEWMGPTLFIEFPLWLPVAICGGLLVCRMAFKYRQPEEQRRCSACGYNLTGNVSGTCPECGAAVPEDLVRRGDGAGQDSKAGQHNEQAEPES